VLNCIALEYVFELIRSERVGPPRIPPALGLNAAAKSFGLTDIAAAISELEQKQPAGAFARALSMARFETSAQVQCW
jgi:hypothetical protein